MFKKKKSNFKRKSIFFRRKKLGLVFMRFTKRNVFCTLINNTDKKVLTSSSVGALVKDKGKRSRLKVSFQSRARYFGILFARKIRYHGFNNVVLIWTGNSPVRDICTEALYRSNLNIKNIVADDLPAHNGCRPPKVRRK